MTRSKRGNGSSTPPQGRRKIGPGDGLAAAFENFRALLRRQRRKAGAQSGSLDKGDDHIGAFERVYVSRAPDIDEIANGGKRRQVIGERADRLARCTRARQFSRKLSLAAISRMRLCVASASLSASGL